MLDESLWNPYDPEPVAKKVKLWNISTLDTFTTRFDKYEIQDIPNENIRTFITDLLSMSIDDLDDVIQEARNLLSLLQDYINLHGRLFVENKFYLLAFKTLENEGVDISVFTSDGSKIIKV